MQERYAVTLPSVVRFMCVEGNFRRQEVKIHDMCVRGGKSLNFEIFNFRYDKCSYPNLTCQKNQTLVI